MTVVGLCARMFLIGLLDIKAVRSVNIALEKPTYQSSETAGGISSRAVDGNSNSDFFGGSCIHTSHGEVEQWWIVDLQGVYIITDVWIQNRNIYISLHDFVVDVFMLNPLELSVTETRTCSNYSGEAPASENVHLTCQTGTSGRYLRVLKLPEFITEPDTDVLIFCEVVVVSRVYKPCGTVKSLLDTVHSSKTSSNEIVQGLGRVECFHLCYYDYRCHGFNSRESDGSCQIITDQDQPMVEHIGWTYYQMY